jgi:hypothetical protein
MADFLPLIFQPEMGEILGSKLNRPGEINNLVLKP